MLFQWIDHALFVGRFGTFVINTPHPLAIEHTAPHKLPEKQLSSYRCSLYWKILSDTSLAG